MCNHDKWSRAKGYKDTSRRHKDKYVHRLRVRPNERTNVNNSSFTPLIKSPAEIYATSEGKAVLRPPSRMFAPAHRRDRTRYSKGAKTQNSNQNPSSSGVSERGKNQVGWKQKMAEPKETNEILMTSTQWSPIRHRPDASPPGTNIAFSEEDPVPEHCNGEDPLIIKADIGGTVIHRVYVDGGSSTEIMYEHWQVLWPLGVITIPLTLFDYHMRGSKTVTTDFLIVRAPLPYNVILGRPGMRQLGAIASTIHSLLKFSTPTGVAIVRGDMPCKDTCLQVSRKREREPEEATKLASPENKSEKEEVEINPLYPDQKVIIGTILQQK
ncbi:hypothetical protein Tco_0892020 [Tanacetum coccineum]|uniref:Reverse transcriptase domain-containing protein n=1 Tax=Tanacetum coccineum TaxID=301880 RepID=A0ABQ5C7T7_9ASTR